ISADSVLGDGSTFCFSVLRACRETSVPVGCPWGRRTLFVACPCTVRPAGSKNDGLPHDSSIQRTELAHLFHDKALAGAACCCFLAHRACANQTIAVKTERKCLRIVFRSAAWSAPSFLRINESSIVTTFANRTRLGFCSPASRHFTTIVSPAKGR